MPTQKQLEDLCDIGSRGPLTGVAMRMPKEPKPAPLIFVHVRQSWAEVLQTLVTYPRSRPPRNLQKLEDKGGQVPRGLPGWMDPSAGEGRQNEYRYVIDKVLYEKHSRCRQHDVLDSNVYALVLGKIWHVQDIAQHRMA